VLGHWLQVITRGLARVLLSLVASFVRASAVLRIHHCDGNAVIRVLMTWQVPQDRLERE
jgi:hypothetical protein